MLATQAQEKRIEPTAPQALKPKQWKALKRALVLDRNERTPTVERFLEEPNVDTPTKLYGLPITAALAAGAAGMMAFGMNYFFAKLNTPVVSDYSKFENSPTVEGKSIIRTDVELSPTNHQLTVPTAQITPGTLAADQDLPAQTTTVETNPAAAALANQHTQPPEAARHPGDSPTGHGPVEHEQITAFTQQSPH